MNLLPKSHQEFSQKEYWDDFFRKRGARAFEWYGEYVELAGYLQKYIKKSDHILIPGCGNSTLGRSLYDVGYRTIVNIDISPVVIKQMNKTAANTPGLVYKQMDALNTTFKDDEFRVILDKGTLDALMPDEQEETLHRIYGYFYEINRITSVGGRYICISLLQEHILKIILEYFCNNCWAFRVIRCFEAEQNAKETGEMSLPVFMVVCSKFRDLSFKLLETCLVPGAKLQKHDTPEEIILQIGNIQYAAFVCAGVQKLSIANEEEVSFDLSDPKTNTVRFSLYLVDLPADRSHALYAAFVVPQGRENEWLFSSVAGRKHLASMIKYNRLAIITMHRGQNYGSFSEIQTELEETVCDMAPNSFKNKKIQFLSLGSDVGKRVTICIGHSKISGDYIIEDTEVESNKTRRLFFSQSQQIVQSEVKLKTIKTRKHTLKEVVDLTSLKCKHHFYMIMASYVACLEVEKPVVNVIGLGGGGLCSFLHKFLPMATIIGVDIDPEMVLIATKWFGLQQDANLKVVVQDGIRYLEQCVKKRERCEAILFDIDNKDSKIGLSCPPMEFLGEPVLRKVKALLGGNGLFVLSLVLRDQSLRPDILKDLEHVFSFVISYKLSEDLNEIFICGCGSRSPEPLIDSLRTVAFTVLNDFLLKNNSSDIKVDIQEFVSSLKITRENIENKM